MRKLTAAATLALRFVRSIGGIHAIACTFPGQFQFIGRCQPLVVLHRSLGRRERHFYLTDSGNRLYRLRYIADAAAASHTCYFKKFSLHDDVPFHKVEERLYANTPSRFYIQCDSMARLAELQHHEFVW